MKWQKRTFKVLSFTENFVSKFPYLLVHGFPYISVLYQSRPNRRGTSQNYTCIIKYIATNKNLFTRIENLSSFFLWNYHTCRSTQSEASTKLRVATVAQRGAIQTNQWSHFDTVIAPIRVPYVAGLSSIQSEWKGFCHIQYLS